MALTKVQNELLSSQYLNPVGCVQMFAGSAAPSGWLLCNGQEYLKSAYPGLNSILSVGGTYPYGQTNGSGGVGTTHFKVPDFRAMFPRGASMGASTVQINSINYTPQSLGTRQPDAMQGHKHNYTPPNPGTAIANVNGTNTGAILDAGSTSSPISDDTNGTPRTASETRPVNLSINFIIKY